MFDCVTNNVAGAADSDPLVSSSVTYTEVAVPTFLLYIIVPFAPPPTVSGVKTTQLP